MRSSATRSTASVDMSNIVLIGHSRGGEAVANAAAFNELSHYPDDATVEFDFGYDIQGIISIAPVDGQYLPTGRKVVTRDLSYLTFHGSHDGDVTSFHGLRIYDRLRFTDPDDFNFKSADVRLPRQPRTVEHGVGLPRRRSPERLAHWTCVA